MKAAQISGYGGTAAMRTVDSAPKPSPASGQVLVEVYAAGVNPFDWKVREGYARSPHLSFPATLGGDFAGVVAEVGEGVEGLEAGQAVYGMAGALSGNGSFAEFAPASAAQIGLKPESLDFIHAAAVPLAGVSAYQALVDHMDLQKGQKILIHGGAGGIASFAVQLAKHIGAYVAATAAGADAGYVTELGADEVIDYRTEDFTRLSGYDAVFDTIGGETNQRSYEVLRPGGVLVSMVDPEDAERAKAKDVRYVSQLSKATPERLQALTGLIDSGAIKIIVDKIFPIEQASDALTYVQQGKQHGKVVIQVKGAQASH